VEPSGVSPGAKNYSKEKIKNFQGSTLASASVDPSAAKNLDEKLLLKYEHFCPGFNAFG